VCERLELNIIWAQYVAKSIRKLVPTIKMRLKYTTGELKATTIVAVELNKVILLTKITNNIYVPKEVMSIIETLIHV
jgi:hypothetical protein